MNIAIVDYGMGNLGSIQNMLKRIGTSCSITADPAVVGRADKIILPGVGAFDGGMRKLADLGLVDVLNETVLSRGTPVLGVCLGMQLMMRRSEEGTLAGLGWIDGETIRFRFDQNGSKLKVPHMGWNTITIEKPGTLFRGVSGQARYYFVHSYHVVCADPADVLARTEYGYSFVSAVQHGTIMGAQFHPEKSHRFGMAVLRNFVESR